VESVGLILATKKRLTVTRRLRRYGLAIIGASAIIAYAVADAEIHCS
jgi:hypothetical protein